jgi:hypothetical protein
VKGSCKPSSRSIFCRKFLVREGPVEIGQSMSRMGDLIGIDPIERKMREELQTARKLFKCREITRMDSV